MRNTLAFKVAGVVFLLVAAAHLLRLVFKLEIIAGTFVVPMWLSSFGFIFALLLAVWVFKSLK
ncbi:MAG TPA: hypothetical protein VMD52_00475 [Patescibacteria group bacterium]|nr:hypothetical protein [Patescibacteria group bacterium]